MVAKDPEIEHVATALRDTYRVEYVAPGHCTGEPTFAALQQIFGASYVYAGVGTVVDLETVPRAGGQATTPAMDAHELDTYRALVGVRERDGH